ncbi:AI-2E family transporter [uncultured Intestinimonas sp.]|uniref:AI-2E family transporter n=1 Tax=uncultured Intestinimonas sp. TaxID=1689265 RepID=UPI0025EF1229|nr:AI-2E family transporter [uncultured Intestinimonas sp.]
MDKKMFRSILILITFTVGLVFVIVRFDDLWHMVRLILSQLTPLFAGLAIAFILSRPCAFFRRTLDRGLKGTPLTGLSLPLAVALSYVLLIGAVAAIFAFVIPQLTSSVGRFAANLSGYLAQVQVWINDITAWLHLEELDLSQFGQTLREFVNSLFSALSTAVPQLLSLTSGLVSVAITMVLALVFSVYLLSGKDTLLGQCRRVLKAYVPKKVYDVVLDVASLTADTFSRFVSGQITEACILGGLTFLGMLILRLDYALLIAVLIGVSALVPVVGAYVGAITSALLLVMVDPIDALIFLIFLVCLQQIEGNVIYPRVVGTSLGLPGIWVLTAVTVGGGLFDLAGVLLSVPVASILYALLKRDVRKRLTRQEKTGE